MNMYRSGGDISASFGSIIAEIYATITWNDRSEPLSFPGCWACKEKSRNPPIALPTRRRRTAPPNAPPQRTTPPNAPLNAADFPWLPSPSHLSVFPALVPSPLSPQIPT